MKNLRILLAVTIPCCLALCTSLNIKAKFCREVDGTTVCAESDGKTLNFTATQK